MKPGMTHRVLILTIVISSVLSGGCYSVDKPYKNDPLIKSEKRQRGSFPKAQEAKERPQEPFGPEAPRGVSELVNGEAQ